MNGEDYTKTGINQNRRVLKHMRYDRQSGTFVTSNQKKLNRMSVSLKVEQNKHMVLREMLYIVEELTFMFLSRDALVRPWYLDS